MSKVIVGNWKMNGSEDHLEDFIPALLQGMPDKFIQAGGVVGICPPAPYLPLLRDLILNTEVKLGAQNVYPKASGAYTGEVSPTILQDLGVAQCIIGHSERRQYFNETDAFVREKLQALVAASIQAIVCVGESLEEREAGRQEAVVSAQVKAALAGFDPAQLDKLVIAYEPIWAIGTGKTASPEQANAMHAVIRGLLNQQFGPDKGKKVAILYGGSVNPANAAELLRQPEIDGALVGGASLKARDFLDIIEAAPL